MTPKLRNDLDRMDREFRNWLILAIISGAGIGFMVRGLLAKLLGV